MFKVKTLERRNLKQLSLSAAKEDADATVVVTDSTTAAVRRLKLSDEPHGRIAPPPPIPKSYNTIRPISEEHGYDLEDLVQLGKLGSGNSGTVMKVLHVPSSRVIAKKTIMIEQNNEIVKRQIYRELTIMRSIGEHRNVVQFYGAFNIASDVAVNGGNEVIILMEYMNCGSLDTISRTYKSLRSRGNMVQRDSSPVQTWFSNPVIISRIAYSVLNGLNYLYENYKIIHRDIKPSNVLINSKGQIKLCDFGVSRKLNNSIADTFVGTSTYMSPERIQGNKYTTKGDVWSLGLMLIELLTGDFPLGGHNDTPDGILDLLQRIVNEPAPKLPAMVASILPPTMVAFINRCCVKDEKERGSLQELLKHPFILEYRTKAATDTFKQWTKDIKQRLSEEKAYKKELLERSKLEQQRGKSQNSRLSMGSK
ncbi:Serine/threonine-protein kinase STE7 [Nakaseomyces bracarensis]|uniref:mitogen-activated protein kinase kinase n=1 Tax=Nakaseomyces bracarensis TaxID=273131 RepID=A0ABR4NW02_9SACH